MNKVVVKNGMSFSGALTLILLTLKLIGVIKCSWWMVFIAFWIGPAFILGIIGFIILVGIVLSFLE